MKMAFQIVLKLLVLMAYFSGEASAFTKSSKFGAIRTSVGTTNGLILGPVARNGLTYEDVVLGSGRRILPGDTVFCYYVGSYKKRLGGETVFDQSRTFRLLAFGLNPHETAL